MTRRRSLAQGNGNPVGHKRGFLAAFLKNPTAVGAVGPSGPNLAQEMVRRASIESARVVVEYGPGTGAFTGAILDRLHAEARFFAIELSATMCALFRERHPTTTIHAASVAEIGRLLEQEGLPPRGSVDVVVSGLPWSVFPLSLQRELLDATVSALRPGGEMVTFAYSGFSALSPNGRAFRKLLPEYFSEVEKGRTVVRNVPPAFVYRCVK